MPDTFDYNPEPSRQLRVLRSIQAKAAQRPTVDANGNPTDDTTTYVYDDHGKLLDIRKPE